MSESWVIFVSFLSVTLISVSTAWYRNTEIYIAVHHREKLEQELYKLLPHIGPKAQFENFIYSVTVPKVRISVSSVWLN